MNGIKDISLNCGAIPLFHLSLYATKNMKKEKMKYMIAVKNLVALPAGKMNGIITASEIVNRTFNPAKGPERRLALTIQPKNLKEGVYPEQEVLFSCNEVNPLSALGKFLARIGKAPNYQTDGNWNELSLVGTEVSFVIAYDEGSQFPYILRDSLSKV